MFKIKVVFLLSIFSLIIATPVFSGNPKVDNFLKKYENAVKRYERMANSGNISFSDLNKMNSDNMELSSAAIKLQGEINWSSSQLSKYSDLSLRFSKALMRLSTKQPSFGY